MNDSGDARGLTCVLPSLRERLSGDDQRMESPGRPMNMIRMAAFAEHPSGLTAKRS